MQDQIAEFVTMAHTPHMLLVAAPPGVGKTTLGVQAAEKHAAAGHRVLYLGPRHDFFQDILRIAKYPAWWYEWLPRQAGDELGKRETCHFDVQMAQWLTRGYDAMSFCSNPRICGWGYVHDGCPYHAQKEIRAPIVFGQHQHLTLGHPLMERFDLIIGDENPLQAFMHHWVIPGRHIAPSGMDLLEPMTELIHELHRLAERDVKAEGPDLLQLLGGPEQVRDVCAGFVLPADAKLLPSRLRGPDAVEDAPYAHLVDLSKLLLREATAALAGHAYPYRVALANGKLHLLLRNTVADEAAGAKLLWLDATANVTLYEALFRRPVELVAPQVALCGQILQVWPRANGKRSLIQDGEPTSKADQLQQQVAAIIAKGHYQNPAIITFEALKSLFDGKRGHFYAARGTNQFEECDALIVAGTPQPDLETLHTYARMVFFERMDAFDREWSERDVPYRHTGTAGEQWSYPVSGFWHDEGLQSLAWQFREAEVIQAAHRVRPVLRNVDVWLLTNLPIDELPPTRLLTIRDLFDAPEGVDPYRWPEVLKLADERVGVAGCVTAPDLVKALACSPTTAGKYIDLLTQQDGWQVVKAATKGPGKPPKAAGRS